MNDVCIQPFVVEDGLRPITQRSVGIRLYDRSLAGVIRPENRLCVPVGGGRLAGCCLEVCAV